MLRNFSVLGLLCVVTSGAARGSCANCCAKLASSLPGKVFSPDSAAYEASLASYWALQEQLITPSCIVSPTTAIDVSTALKIIVPDSCKFAVRGGGHGTAVGVANIEDGITIDLRGIDTIVLSEDKEQVAVGGAATLGDVYTYLAQYGVSIPGARAAGIGVGGSTLGGGFGYFAPSQGLAADSVAEYEVVLANGDIITANQQSNSDLWRALKGGGSNFGIVTKLTFNTFPLGEVWAGDVFFSVSNETVQSTATALYNFASNPDYDENASVFVLYAYQNAPVVLVEYTYTAPVVDAPVFDEFEAVPGQLLNTTAVTTIPTLSASSQAQSPSGFEQITFAMTFVNDEQMILEAYNIMIAASSKLTGVAGAAIGLTLRPIVPSMIRPDDVLGLEVPAQGLIQTIGSVQFNLTADYSLMNNVADQMLSDLEAAAKRLGVYNRYIDMNHAKTEQKVLEGYGSQNYELLKAVAGKYDPKGVFQNLMPGGFKLLWVEFYILAPFDSSDH
ncbi:hypothetical protein JX265_004708 [Neoarthrinium moseri]|uniref:FAD-binding PCMH-type domain-containing protein n=1 Tax=Neoarthrinium moseri TaxID=1658444 RepID=A0A9P9WPP2_9PEZI|nr:hypothetical protein JX265_004708 [Neoarthrinium moseri]